MRFGHVGTAHPPAWFDQKDCTVTPSSIDVDEQTSPISHHPPWLHVPATPNQVLPSGSVADSTISWLTMRVRDDRLPELVIHAK
jgi:hypothetical protein